MVYFKVKKEADQIPVYRPKKHGYIVRQNLIANELYTQKELEELCEDCGLNFDKFSTKHFKLIQISSRNTYIFFGARFER